MKPDIIRKCIIARGGLEIWVEAERADHLSRALADKNAPKFIEIENQYINTFEILYILTPEAMEERQRRKNGQWQCMKGKWHDKGQVCECKEYKETVKAYVEGVGEVIYKK